MDFESLARKYDTPLYVYDFDLIKEKFISLQASFSGISSLVCYAMKANSNLSLLKMIASLDGGVDCVSINEVKKALMVGIKPYRIIFSGVGKKDEEIEEALLSKVLMINLESEQELYRIEDISKKLKVKARISVRVNPNVDAKTHAYISTGLHENKFGVNSEDAIKIYIYSKQSEFLEPIGIHFHIGSQLIDLKPIEESIKIIDGMVKNLKALDIDIKFFDVGGGIGIKYDNEDVISFKEYADVIKKYLKLKDITVVCEMGRAIVGESGYFLSKVLYEKKNGDKRFVIVDGAMNDLIRPSLYNAYHKSEIITKNTDSSTCDVVGPVCESGDFLAKNQNLKHSNHGDINVVYCAGAYGFSLSSNYNSRVRCAEVAIINGKDRLVRKREIFDDLIKNEIEFLDD
jgi:diaminopimelate decarboxylase